jgi:hypothetical protein
MVGEVKVTDCPSAIIEKARKVNDLRALVFCILTTFSNHFFERYSQVVMLDIFPVLW